MVLLTAIIDERLFDRSLHLALDDVVISLDSVLNACAGYRIIAGFGHNLGCEDHESLKEYPYKGFPCADRHMVKKAT